MGNLRVDPSLFSHNGHIWQPNSQPSTLVSAQTKTHAIYIHTKNISHRDLSIMKLRANYGQYLVPIISIVEANELQMADKSGYYILIEKIEYRLADLGVISLEDGIYILGQGIQAIRALGQAYRNFVFETDMIGISSSGQCKYWVNSNYFNNEVESVGVEKEKEKERDMRESMIYGYGERENEWMCRQFGKEGKVEDSISHRHTLMRLFQEIESKMQFCARQFSTSPYTLLKEKFSLHNDCTIEKAQKFRQQLWQVFKINESYRIKMPTLQDTPNLAPNMQVKHDRKKQLREHRILQEEGNTLFRGIYGVGKQRDVILGKGTSGVKMSTSPKLSLKKNRRISNKKEEHQKLSDKFSTALQNTLESTKAAKFQLSELATESSRMLTQKRVIRGGNPIQITFHSRYEMLPQTAA